jgi:hypothetical protein
LIGCKNTKNSFDAYGEVEDSKFAAHTVNLKEGYDGYGFGAGSSLMYEGVDSGLKSSNQFFAVLAHGNLNTRYVYMCYNSSYLFGCVGIRKNKYCILNKQYSKEEYEEMLPKIIKHMEEMPYLDKNGAVYKYGEFFPSELSPFAYNETIAQEMFPRDKNEILRDGYVYRAQSEKESKATMNYFDLPDHIRDVSDDILNEIITCPNDGNEKTQCTKRYRILSEELKFLRKANIALPRYCPNCRHFQRLDKRNPMRLWHRACMKKDCYNEFETTYAPDRPEIVYCESCYQQEVI